MAEAFENTIVKKSDEGKVGDVPKKSDLKSDKSVSASHKKRLKLKNDMEKAKAALQEQHRIDAEREKLREQAELDRIRLEFKMRALERQQEEAKQRAEMLTKWDEIKAKLSPCESSSDSQELQSDDPDAEEDALSNKMNRLLTTEDCSFENVSVGDDVTFRLPKKDTTTNEMLKHIIRLQPFHVNDFNGNTEDYFAFRNAFKQLEKKDVHDEDDLLSILLAHVKEDAKRALSGILHGSGQYKKAWEVLEGRYGNKTRITNSKLTALRKHSEVSANNLSHLRSLIDSVSAFLEAMRCAGREQETENALLIIDLLPKLPRSMSYNWNKMIARGQAKETLQSFKEFLLMEEKVWEVDCTYRDETYKQKDKRKFESKKMLSSHHEARYTGVTVSSTSADCPIHQGKGHQLANCKTFIAKSVSERLKIARKYGLCFLCLGKGHMTSSCASGKHCMQRGCNKPHHELLHAGEALLSGNDENRSWTNTQPKTTEVVSSYAAIRQHRTLLGVLPVKILGPRKSIVVNAFIDYGSNTTMISMELAKSVGLLADNVSMRTIEVVGVHGTGMMTAACIQRVRLQTINDKQCREDSAASVLAVKDFTGPSQQLDWDTVKYSFPNIQDYGLTDVSADAAQMIIGTDNFHLIVYDHYVLPARGHDPVLVHTALGYTLLGRLPSEDKQTVVYRSEVKLDKELAQQVDDYFMLENLGVENIKQSRLMSVEDQRALKTIAEGTKRMADEKAFVSAMPWKFKSPQLPDNKEMALQRLYTLERKLSKQPALYEKYKQAIVEDEQKGYIRQLSPGEDALPSNIKWYLPHWNVVHKKKPEKFRRVYDCSAVYKGESLNKQLMKGPNLLADLFDVLVRFREYPIAMAADVNEMYNQIRIPEDDQPSLQFLWRDNVTEEVATYRFKRMLFGDVSAPARAVHVLNCIARDGAHDKPIGALAIKDNMYLDDLMTSCMSEQTAVAIQQEARALVEDGGFRFKKWVSNIPAVLEGVQAGDRVEVFRPAEKCFKEISHVLGVIWSTTNDSFGYESHDWTEGHTRREVLSQLTSLWDPLGFLAPFVVRAKFIVQDIWKLNTGSDDKIPDELHARWLCWLEEAKRITEV